MPHSNDLLFAPDVQRFGDTYNLYYCLASGTNTEGIATSKSPNGPFVDGRVIDLQGTTRSIPPSSSTTTARLTRVGWFQGDAQGLRRADHLQREGSIPEVEMNSQGGPAARSTPLQCSTPPAPAYLRP